MVIVEYNFNFWKKVSHIFEMEVLSRQVNLRRNQYLTTASYWTFQFDWLVLIVCVEFQLQ